MLGLLLVHGPAVHDSLPGIESVVSGYTGGHTENPTYEEVCSERPGIRKLFKSHLTQLCSRHKDLVRVYWQQTDPTDAMGRVVDRGTSYRPVIFYRLEQKEIAEASKQVLQDSGKFTKPIDDFDQAGPTVLRSRRISSGFLQKVGAHYHGYRSHSRARFVYRITLEKVENVPKPY